MRRLVRDNAVAGMCVAIALVLVAWNGLGDFAFTDYDVEASASVHALVTGHVLVFLRTAPPYGGSLLLRAPFALLPGVWGGGELAVYRMLALPGLLALAALTLWLTARMRAQGAGRLARATLVGVLLAGPATVYTLIVGHPEEILAGVILVAAVLTARAGRWPWAAVLLGLAIATKSWALIGVAPVLATLPAARWRALVVAGAVALIVFAPFELAQRLDVRGGGAGITATATGHLFNPWQAWWFAGDPHRIVRTNAGRVKVGYRAAPAWVSTLAHPLIVLAALPLSLLWWRRRHGRACEPLALLALVLLMRCALDPWNNFYYHVPFLLAFAAWDALRTRGVPVLALSATVATSVIFQRLPGDLSPDGQAAAYLAWAAATTATLGLWLYAPRWWERLAAALTSAARPPGRARLASAESVSAPGALH